MNSYIIFGWAMVISFGLSAISLVTIALMRLTICTPTGELKPLLAWVLGFLILGLICGIFANNKKGG